MLILGLESSCDECAVAVVEDGKKIHSNVITTQIDQHKVFNGVVPEIASRLHTEWIYSVTEKALEESGFTLQDMDGIAVTSRPGLVGSLLVGLSFAKGLSAASGIPFLTIDHMKAHVYAPFLEYDIEYPFIGLIVSGGHSIICKVYSFDDIEVLGTTVDDACGEAFDKVAKHYNLGYPGGVVIDRLAKEGNPKAFHFPQPDLSKRGNPYLVSYSGLKTAVINQLEQFHNKNYPITNENIAASFQKTAIDILTKRTIKAAKEHGLSRIVAGGGVSANSYLRSSLKEAKGFDTYFPSMKLCTDNGAMIAGLAYHYFKEGKVSSYSESASSRVSGFKTK